MENLFEKLSRKEDSHKGQNGKVLVIGGSRKYTGAPALSAQAALRAGADLVKVFTSEDVRPVVQGFSENLIVESYGKKFDEASIEDAQRLEEWADVTVIGPGLTGFNEESLKEFADGCGKLVVDAEAIGSLLDISDNIFTPHAGEAEVIEEKYGSSESFSQETDNTVLLKGKIDRVLSANQEFENDAGCAGMTAGGTGDVLAGVVASFSAQGLDDYKAARLGAYVNGCAGEKACKEFGNGLVATDLLDKVAKVISEKS